VLESAEISCLATAQTAPLSWSGVILEWRGRDDAEGLWRRKYNVQGTIPVSMQEAWRAA